MTLDPDLTEGAIVLYRDPHFGTGGHTGKVLALPRNGHIRVLPTAGGRTVVLPTTHVAGYWPKGCRKHHPDRLRPLEG